VSEERKDLQAALAVILAGAGFLLLPLTIQNPLHLFPSMLLIFLGIALAVEADD